MGDRNKRLENRRLRNRRPRDSRAAAAAAREETEEEQKEEQEEEEQLKRPCFNKVEGIPEMPSDFHTHHGTLTQYTHMHTH